MRIVVVGPVPPIRGGISQHTARLSESLRQRSHDVDLRSWKAQYPRFLYRRPQLDDRAEPAADASFELRWYDPASWIRVGRAARRADLLVVPWITAVHAVPYQVIGRLARPTPIVMMVHNVTPHERLPLSNRLTRSTLGLADRFVCHARSLVDELGRLGLGSTPVAIVPHPPNLPVEPGPLPLKPPVRLLFLGYLRHYKGADIAVEATASLVERGHDVVLTVAGEPWGPTDDLEVAVADERLTGRVELITRYVSDQELVTLLAEHHLLLAPYRTATQSGVVGAALGAGRPVVATRVGGLPDVVLEGSTGTLAEPDDVAAFADAVERAMSELEVLHRGVADASVGWDVVADAITGQDD